MDKFPYGVSGPALLVLADKIHYSAVRAAARVAANHAGNSTDETHVARAIMSKGKD